MAREIHLKVLDVSHHNDVRSFEQVRDSGIRGIIHKSTQGTRYVDPTYEKRREQALAAGLLWGAYHFATGEDPVAQVAHFLGTVSPDEKTLVALDFEPNKGSQMNLAQARAFCRELEDRLGRKAVIYSGNLVKETLGDAPDEYLGSHRLWLAQYGPNPKWPKAWTEMWLWQYSGDGVGPGPKSVPGIKGALDLNSYDGTDEELAASWAS